MTAELVTKAEFAGLIGVSPGRVSQYIAAGKLGRNELEGAGRAAKVKVPEALAALKLRLDPGQMLGNGIETKLAAQPQAPVPPSEEDDLDLRLKRSKLEQQEHHSRRLKEEERARAGIYVLADEARAEIAKVAAQVLQAFEGGLADIATLIAAQYALPQRDVVHLVRTHFRAVRAATAEKLRSDAAVQLAEIDTEPEH